MAAQAAHPDIVRVLNDILTGELTAINQYFLHAKMCADWGYTKLAAFVRHESIDEMKHAEAVIDRILYLDGMPNVQRMGKVNIGETVLEQFELDLALERVAIPRLIEGIKVCREHGDEGTRVLLEGILTDEEEHTDWLESQLEVIKQIGIQNYLAVQL